MHATALSNICSNNTFFESVTSHNPEKVIFNFSNQALIVQENSLLCKGLDFSIPPKNSNYSYYLLLPFEMLYRDNYVLGFPGNDEEDLYRVG